MKEESGDDNKAKAFDFVIESHKSEVRVQKESNKSVKERKEKGVKEIGGFMRAEEENLTNIPEEKRNISWSSNIEKIEEANSVDNMGLTSRAEPTVSYQ